MNRRAWFGVTTLLMVGASTTAVASEPHDGVASGSQPYPSFGVQLDPVTPILGAAFGMFAIEFEFQAAMTDYVGLSLIPAFVWTKVTSDGEDTTAYGFSVRVGPRFFPQGRRLDGTYILPFLSFTSVYASNDSDSSTEELVSPGIEAGYAWTWSNGFSMNLGGGLAYNFYVHGTKPSRIPIVPIINFTLGYVW